MNEFLTFLKDIFMINNASTKSIGLTQFRTEPAIEQITVQKPTQKKEIKLSDLMRRS